MKIECVCGHIIHDGADALQHKAHLIPDQSWHTLFEKLDDLIEHRCSTRAERDAACTLMRSLIGRASRTAWQCAQCGRLYIDDRTGHFQAYVPADGETSRGVLRSSGA